MTLTIILMVVLAIVVLAFVLEPVIRARMDRVEVNAVTHPDPVPDFRQLLEQQGREDQKEVAQGADVPSPAASPEPAEHRS